MIAACMITYNDMPLIKQSINSVYNKVDKIICVDGRYRDFPDSGKNWYSTDGTLEYLSSLDNVKLLFGAGLFEADKRNIYINELNEGDTFLILDSDEVVEGDIKELPKGIDAGLVGFREMTGGVAYLATRMFMYKKGLHHNGIHFILEIDGKWVNNRRQILKGFNQKIINDFKIMHLQKSRDNFRKVCKTKYYETLGLREAMYKTGEYE